MRRLLVLLAPLSCSVDPAGETDASITTAAIESTTSDDRPSVNTVTSAGAGGSSGHPIADVGSGEWTLSPACGRLDVVFVVERSFTTSARFYADAPSIFAGLASALPGWSVHVMAVEGRVGTIPGFCEEACSIDGECEAAWEPVSCGELTTCDWTRGAGMIWDGPAQRCVDGSQRWMDLGDSTALEEFRCLWSGATGAGEIDTVTSLLGATSSTLTDPDGCNHGFLREDAFLIPVLVSHGYPTAPGSPASWAEDLSAAKAGEPDQILPVVILDPQTQPWDPPGCEEGPGDDGRYETFAGIFEGVVGNICTNYSTPVLEAASRVAARCVDAPG